MNPINILDTELARLVRTLRARVRYDLFKCMSVAKAVRYLMIASNVNVAKIGDTIGLVVLIVLMYIANSTIEANDASEVFWIAIGFLIYSGILSVFGLICFVKKSRVGLMVFLLLEVVEITFILVGIVLSATSTSGGIFPAVCLGIALVPVLLLFKIGIDAYKIFKSKF